MTLSLTPPAARRLGAVAIAAALAAFAGIAGAQTAQNKAPGFATSGSGNTLYSGSGGCVRTQASATYECPPMATARSTSATAQRTQVAQSDRSSRSSAAPAAAAGATSANTTTTGGPLPQATPGYAMSSDGKVILSGSGQCVRAGHWSPANAAEPCDRVPRADMAPPPVAAVPAPAPEPAPQLSPAPPPQAVAQPEPPRPVIQKLTLSTDVLFDFNSANLKDGGKSRLDQLVSEIKDADVDEIVAVGHADRIASDDYNQKLSEARAQAVKDYLASKGARGNTITAEGKGESQPVTGEKCQKMGTERGSNKKLVECLQPDRRVEIEVLGSRQVAGTGSPAGTGSTGGAGSTSR